MQYKATIAASIALVGCCASAQCQTPDIGQVLSGKNIPLTTTLSNLNGDWRTFTIDTGADAYTSMLSAMSGGPAFTGYFTKGDTVNVGPDVYLIAYKPHSVPIDISKFGTSRPTPSALAPNTELDLSLLNLHTIGSMNNIHTFNMADEIAKSNDSASSIQKMYANAQTGEQTASSTAHLSELAMDLMRYMSDHDYKYPDMRSVETVKKALSKYDADAKLFTDPSNNRPYAVNSWLSGRSLESIDDPGGIVAVYQSKPASDGTRAVAFADGEVKSLSSADWTKAKAKSHIK